MLAKKVLLIFAAADRLNSPVVLSGLLGGGAYRNNRPLVLLLHLLLQPVRPAAWVQRSWSNASWTSPT